MNLISQKQIRGLDEILQQAQNINVGVTPISSGVSSVQVSGVSFSSIPSGINITINKPSGESPNLMGFPYGATESGFFVELSSTTQEEGYKLTYEAVFL